MDILQKLKSLKDLDKKDVAKVGGILLLFFATFVGGYYAHPANITEKERIEYVDRVTHEVHTIVKEVEVEKVVYQEKDTSHKDVDKTSTTITKKDGTQIVYVHEKDITDHTHDVNKDTTISITKDVDTTAKTSDTKKLTDDSSKSVSYSRPDWHVAAGIGSSITELSPIYGVEIDRRIIGTLSLGVEAQSNKVVSLKLGLDF